MHLLAHGQRAYLVCRQCTKILEHAWMLWFLLLLCRLFAGVVPRVLWISLGGFVFLGAYEKFSMYLQTWQNLPHYSLDR